MISDFDNFKEKLEDLIINYSDKIEMPEFSTFENKFSNGANAFEGYQRGWGLEYSRSSEHFSDIVEQIRNDELYNFALSAAENLTVVSEERRMNMFLLLTKYIKNIENGDWIEFGSYKGGNAIFLAIISKVIGSNNKIFACDSFVGMPKTDKSLDLHNEGDFSDSNFEFLSSYINKLKLDNIHLVKGFFSESLKRNDMSNLNFSFAHIDADIYEACDESFKYVKGRMVDKGYIVFDDATVSSCIGATRFVEEKVIRESGLNSEQIWPHFVFRVSS